MKKKYIYLLCGYPGLEEGHFVRIENGKKNYSNPKGTPTFEICPCCGTEFGFSEYDFKTESKKSWEKIRKEWIDNGAEWFMIKMKPHHWDLNKQLLNLKKLNED